MNNVRQIAVKYIDQIQKSGIPVTNAFLFGSYAKGNANKFSDIDICIVSPKFKGNYFDDSLKLKKIANKIDYRIEPVPFGQDDINNRYSTLAVEIVKYGGPILN